MSQISTDNRKTQRYISEKAAAEATEKNVAAELPKQKADEETSTATKQAQTD